MTLVNLVCITILDKLVWKKLKAPEKSEALVSFGIEGALGKANYKIYLANATARFSLITVTFICPGYCISS